MTGAARPRSAVEREFVTMAGELGLSLGLNRTVGQIYGILYLSERHLSLDEIVGRLGVSKGSVSLNIRELERWGAVRKIWVPGTRKDYYEACTDLAGILYARMKKRCEKLLESTAPQLQGFIESREFGPLQRDRLGHLLETRDLLVAALKLLPAEISAPRLSAGVRRLRTLKSVLGGG